MDSCVAGADVAAAEDSVIAKLERAREETAEEFRRYSDSATFYRESLCLGAELDAWHALPERRRWTELIVQLAREERLGTIIDIGCGGGHDLRALHFAGWKKHQLHAVEPNVSLRSRVAAFSTTYSCVDDVANIDADCIICIDVLEHVPTPELILRVIERCLPVGGWLVESTPTFDISTPLHLAHLRGWSPNSYLRQYGFCLVQTDGRLHFWKRVSKQVSQTQSAIVVAYRSIDAVTAQRLCDLSAQGWNVLFAMNDALVERGRSMAVSSWWRELPDDVFLMIDADIEFTIADAEKLVERCRSGYYVIAAQYALRDGSGVACRLFPGQAVHHSHIAQPVQIASAATGFLAVHREVIRALIERLPLCHADQPWSFWPFFQTEIVQTKDGLYEFLSEDWSFSRRVRECGFEVWLDPTIDIGHRDVHAWRLRDINNGS